MHHNYKVHITYNQHKKLKPGLVASYDIRPVKNGDYSGRMGMDSLHTNQQATANV